MRVILLSIFMVFILFIGLLITRFWGQGQQFADFQHTYFEGAAPVIILKANTDSQIQEAIAAKSDIAIWLNVETTLDKKIIVFSKEFLQNEMSVEAYRGGRSMAYDLQKLKLIHPEIQELSEILKKYPAQRFVLNVMDNVDHVHKWLTESTKGLNGEKRIVLQSEYNVVLNSIKELEPFWLYGSSKADLMRFMAFESMWILPAVPFKGDVFIAPFKLMKRTAFSDNIIDEVRRRKKKIILGPATNKAEYDNALRLKADGIVIEKLTDFSTFTRP
ncbi:MAG: hypothetical protein EOP04_12035 [Proteobacteria bacterium]|nr:MAG: hypothetical protein EOP04_12035 [Pseudomonadota bacterium]